MRFGGFDAGGPIWAKGAHIRAGIRNPIAFLAFLALAGCGGSSSTSSATVPGPAPTSWPQVSLSRVAGGFVLPVHVTHAGDGSDRIFVVEQGGGSGSSTTGQRFLPRSSTFRPSWHVAASKAF